MLRSPREMADAGQLSSPRTCKIQTRGALAAPRTVPSCVQARYTSAVLALAVLALLTGCGGEAPPTHDVVLITLDTTRADRLGLYGNPLDTSPNLDRLGAESIVFDHALAQAAVTPVSHASILTGLEPYNHGLRTFHGQIGNRLDERIDTLAEIWRRAGGTTAAFVSAYPVTADFGLAQGFEIFDAEFDDAAGGVLVDADGIVNTGRSQRRADDTVTAALTWLKEEAPDDRPWLLWVHLFDPHDILLLPPERILRRFPPATQDRPDVLRAIYDAEVFFMDAQIGRLLDALRRRERWDKTVVAVVSDHGEGLGDHDWWSHGILYQEQIRVPLILRVPELPDGSRRPDLVRTTDLVPTLVEAAGIPGRHVPRTDGRGLLAAATAEPLEEYLAYADSVNVLSYARPDVAEKMDRKSDKLYSLSDGRFKLIYHQLEPANLEFYDLEADPGELVNLAAERPPAMLELLAELERRDALSEIQPGMTPTDLERLKRLEGLGYVE